MARSISQKEYDKRATSLLEKLQRDVSIFDDPSDAAKAKRKKRASTDLLYFCKTYFPHHFDEDWEEGHHTMADSLNSFNKIIQWLGFRGCGKTTLAFVGFGLHSVLFKNTHYLPIIADNDDLAELLMMPMKVELENNPRLKHDFGEQKGYPWKQDNLVTRNNVKIEASSWKSFKRGRKHMQYRPSIIIGDDWESLESVKNAANSEKREDALLGDILNALDLKKEWRMLMVTNKLGREDLSTRLEDNEAVETVKIPARVDSKLDGEPTHPKSFSNKVLDNILSTIKMVRFSREYLLKIVSSEHDDFQEQWFVWIKKPNDQYLFKVLSLDPSVGSTEGHDSKGIVCTGLTEDLKYFDVINSWIRHDTIGNMCKALFRLNTLLNPHEVVIERNGFQVLIKEKLMNMARNNPKRMDLLTKIHLVQNNVPKNTRIMRTQPMNENGSLRYVKGAGDNEVLVNQKLEFKSDRTDNTDDGPDSEEMGIRRLKQKAGMISNEVEAQVID